MLTIFLFIIGFYLLIKGADLLVTGSSSIAKNFNIPNIVIGLVIVAFGTSLPEMFINIIGGLEGKSDIVIGNILGSNISNILLILGISAIISPLSIQKNTAYKEIPFALLSVVAMLVMVEDIWLNNQTVNILSKSDGIIFLLLFVVFLYYIFAITFDKKAKKEENLEKSEIQSLPIWRSLIYIIIGMLGLILGGKWIVDGAVFVATILGLSQSVIGLTIIAIGTSLPELATSVVASLKKQTDIVIGNIIGSNIFNILWILGITSSIKDLPFNQNLKFDLLVTILTTLLLFIIVFIGKKYVLQKWQGYLLVTFYIIYIAYTVLIDLKIR